MYRKYGHIFAPRQQLLRCSNKLHPCNDAIYALPPSMVVVYRKEPAKALWRVISFHVAYIINNVRAFLKAIFRLDGDADLIVERLSK